MSALVYKIECYACILWVRQKLLSLGSREELVAEWLSLVESHAINFILNVISQDIERSAVKTCFGIVFFFSSELGRSVGRSGREM